ncbi:MAG: hypothetical protein ACI8XB_001778 [Patiriisocius sp.]|jgi:hypothetical protein
MKRGAILLCTIIPFRIKERADQLTSPFLSEQFFDLIFPQFHHITNISDITLVVISLRSKMKNFTLNERFVNLSVNK